MAEEKDDFWLKSELNNDQIPIAIDLAVALRADEVEKFLELYDNIPESIETERIEKIKEMARQLAALPKKQFDMYRTKARILGSGDHFNLPLASTLNIKENVTFDPINHVNINTSLNSHDYKNDENMDLKNVSETVQENQTTGAKSSKKKSKKKKNSKTRCVEQQSVLHNGDITNTSDKDSSQKQNILIENKLLDPDQSSSRIATMNRMLVADICTVCSADSNKTFNESWNDQSHCNNLDLYIKLEGKAENKDESNSDVDAPFGYPLSASKLIQSAVGLLDDAIGRNSSSIKSTNSRNSEFMRKLDRNKQDYEIKVEKNCVNIKVTQDAPIEINGCVADYNKNNRKTTSKTRDQNPTKKSDTEGETEETESVDGDISNLSALEDEGWQSQVRRSHRRKKKELASRNLKERNQLDQKNKKSFQKEHRTNNFKKQTSKNNANNGNLNGVLKETLKTSSKDIEEGLTKVSVKNEEKGKAQEGAIKPAFSYRDALLKTKPKPSEELQYYSDSGVDVNSVSSCDSAIHSPKMSYEFDLKQAVNFLIKGCVEVAERQKQGKVQYYHDTSEFQAGNKKVPVQQTDRKGSGFSRPKKANPSK